MWKLNKIGARQTQEAQIGTKEARLTLPFSVPVLSTVRPTVISATATIRRGLERLAAAESTVNEDFRNQQEQNIWKKDDFRAFIIFVFEKRKKNERKPPQEDFFF